MAIPRAGENFRGYTLKDDFNMAGGGTCQWTFATKDGNDYFLKIFLEPKVPKPGGLGSPAIQEQRKQRCREFERHQRDLMERVRKVVGTDGRLVAPIEFFESDGHYYKIAHKVTVSPGAEKALVSSPITDRINLMINVVTALQSLHSASIVHGDLKLDNILIEKRHDGGLIARVIDFDSSYIAKSPPSSDDILGDPPYYSPELLDYIQGRIEGDKLHVASDIFSLGIVFTQYLTGAKPSWTGDHNYLSEAVRADETITLPPIRGADGRELELVTLLRSMLSKESGARPGLMGIKTRLTGLRDTTGGIPTPPPRPPEGPSGPESSGPSSGPETPRTPTPPTSVPEGISKEIADLVSKILAMSVSAPAPVSKLRGPGLPAPTPLSSTAGDEFLKNIKKHLETFIDSEGK